MEVIEKKEREKEEIKSAIRETAKIKEAREELEGIEKRGADEELLQPLREQLERHEEVAQKVLESAWGANIEKKEEQEAEPLLREGTSLDEMYIGKKANEIKEQFEDEPEITMAEETEKEEEEEDEGEEKEDTKNGHDEESKKGREKDEDSTEETGEGEEEVSMEETEEEKEDEEEEDEMEVIEKKEDEMEDSTEETGTKEEPFEVFAQQIKSLLSNDGDNMKETDEETRREEEKVEEMPAKIIKQGNTVMWRYKCGECSKGFNNLKKKKRHDYACKNKREKRYSCRICKEMTSEFLSCVKRHSKNKRPGRCNCRTGRFR